MKTKIRFGKLFALDGRIAVGLRETAKHIVAGGGDIIADRTAGKFSGGSRTGDERGGDGRGGQKTRFHGGSSLWVFYGL